MKENTAYTLQSNWPKIGHGIGLRSDHWTVIQETRPAIDWLEVVSENHMDTEGRALTILEDLRRDYPICCHGVSMNIGSTDPVNKDYLKELKKLIHRIEPPIVSDHLCWTGVDGANSHDLLPLPQTKEVIDHVVNKVHQVQDFLQRRILLENASTYVAFEHSTLPEWEFISEIAKRSGCGILLDLNNVYVNSFNHKFDPKQYIQFLDPECVGQYHLAGHIEKEDFLFDTHSREVKEEVWDLYRLACRRFDHVPTLIEWDADIPPLEKLLDESQKAKEIEHEQAQLVLA
ncbi:MAG: DUF692 domain-containing protein [Bdellovibrionota bacterium]